MDKSNPLYWVWVIAYIDVTHLDKVQKQLGRYQEYEEIEAYIPTVKILKKTFKGQNHFEEVPLLFNYGFFKIPRKYAVYKNYLDDLKANVSCIFAWVSDTAKVVGSELRLRKDGKSVYKDTDIPVGTATSEEIAELIKSAYYSPIYSGEEIDRLKPGQIIILRGYPFENMQVEVVEVYPKKHKVKVKMEMIDNMREVEVSFDNIFFTIYHAHDENVTVAESLDAMAQYNQDKITAKLPGYDSHSQ